MQSATQSDQQGILHQHACGGTEQEIFQPRLTPPVKRLDHRQKHHAKAEKHRQDGTNRRILGQPCVPHDPIDKVKPDQRACPRAEQKPGQITPIAPKRHHHEKGQGDPRQGRMRHGIRDKRAFAQE